MPVHAVTEYHVARSIVRAVQVLSIVLGVLLSAFGLLGISVGRDSMALGIQILLLGLFAGALTYVICAAILALFDIADMIRARESRESIADRKEIPKPPPLPAPSGAFIAPMVPVTASDPERKVLTEADIGRMEKDRKR